jgi:hypothetical protein
MERAGNDLNGASRNAVSDLPLEASESTLEVDEAFLFGVLRLFPG